MTPVHQGATKHTIGHAFIAVPAALLMATVLNFWGWKEAVAGVIWGLFGHWYGYVAGRKEANQ